MPNFTTEEILRRYPRCLQANIREVAANAVGLTKSLVQINLPPNKTNDDYEIDHGNSLILDIPYAGKHFQCEIVFNDEDLTFAPDFDILNDTFLSDPDTDLIEKYLSALCDWDVEDPTSLIGFVRQLFELYKTHQLEKFVTDPKYGLLQEEFLQLKKKLMLNKNDAEVFTENNAQHFLISLKLDYSELPVYIQRTYFPDGILTNPGIDQVTLKLSFYQRRKVPFLQLSPRLEDIFSMYSSLHIPPFNKNATMAEYVQTVEEFLKGKLDYIRLQFKKKEQYIAVLLSLHGDNVIEYDNIGFTKATFVFEIDSFACLAQIQLSEHFPTEMPLVTLRSMYHKDASGMPASLVLKSYPYSPEWRVKEMVDKLLMHIRNEITSFKSHCLHNLSQ